MAGKSNGDNGDRGDSPISNAVFKSDDVDAKLLCKRCRRLAGACHRARIDRVDRFRTQELGQSARLRVATRVQVGICGSLRHLLPNWQSMAYQNELHLSGRSW